MQPQDEGEEKEEDDRSKDNSVDGESLVFTHMHSLTLLYMYCDIYTTCTIMLTSLPDFAAELLLNMMVDDNCNRLDYLEAELIKLQKAG